MELNAHSFDIVSPIRSPAADAELLEVVDKVISEFSGMRGSSAVEYEFHVSHESSEYGQSLKVRITHETVLSTILAATPARCQQQVLRTFKALGSSLGFSQARAVLSGIAGLPKPLLDDLEQSCVAGEIVRWNMGLADCTAQMISPLCAPSLKPYSQWPNVKSFLLWTRYQLLSS